MPQRVLVIEPDNALRECLRTLLSADGYWVLACGSSAEELRYCRTLPAFHVALTNYRNTGPGGPQVLQWVKKYLMTPVIAYSTDGTAAGEVMKQGASRFLIQPFTPLDVRQALSSVAHLKNA